MQTFFLCVPHIPCYKKITTILNPLRGGGGGARGGYSDPQSKMSYAKSVLCGENIEAVLMSVEATPKKKMCRACGVTIPSSLNFET